MWSAPDGAEPDGAGWALTPSGRYAHAAEYVAAAARDVGFRVDEAVAFTPRWENGAPVNGTLFVLHKP